MYLVYFREPKTNLYWYLCQFPLTTETPGLSFSHSPDASAWELDLYGQTVFPTLLMARMARSQFFKGFIGERKRLIIRRVKEEDLSFDTGY